MISNRNDNQKSSGDSSVLLDDRTEGCSMAHVCCAGVLVDDENVDDLSLQSLIVTSRLSWPNRQSKFKLFRKSIKRTLR